MHRKVVHFEIGCNDLTKTSQFYNKVFGWNFTEEGNSARIDNGSQDGLPGHITQLAPDEPQQYITIYIESNTISKDLQMVKENGGKVLVGPIELPDGRSFAWIQDTAGNIVGIITPASAE